MLKITCKTLLMATVAHKQCWDSMRHRLTTTALAHVWNFQRNELQQLNSPRAQASIGVVFFRFLCAPLYLMCMQTNDVTFLYLLVVFDAISAQTIVMSTAHILLPNVHHTKSIYACALYSWPVSFQPRIQIMVVVVADVVVVILGFLFFPSIFLC